MIMIHHASLGHTGGDLSSADILAVLYFGGVLRVDPEHPSWPQRDRFILSKGHCSAAFYSTLAALGFFPIEQLGTFMDSLSILNGILTATRCRAWRRIRVHLVTVFRSRWALRWLRE
jgi:transketolase